MRLVLFGLAFMPNSPIRLEPFPQMLTILPTLVFWFWFGSKVKRYADLEPSLVMTRSGSRRAWARTQLVFLGICSLAYSALSNASVLLAASLIGGAIPSALGSLPLNVALETPVLTLGAILANLLSFGTDGLVAFTIVAGTHAVVLLLAPIVLGGAPVVALALPSTSGLVEARGFLAQEATMAAGPLLQGASYALPLFLVLLTGRALTARIHSCDLL